MNSNYKTFIISRTDKIGDVVLTLPLATFLKNKFTDSKVIFICSSYTKSIVNCCSDVDEIIEKDKLMLLSQTDRINYFMSLNADVFFNVFPDKDIAFLAFKSKVPVRIGTSHKFFHLLYCNFTVNFSRKNSDLHESQLNFKLLSPLGFKNVPKLSEISLMLNFQNFYPKINESFNFIDATRINIIFHPMSNGSAVEWPMRDYVSLCNLLSEKHFNVIFAGVAKDKEMYEVYLKGIKREYMDVGGLLSLEEYISLIDSADALVAASTGPLHLASALGKFSFGIYLEKRPVHSGRWAPIGKNPVIFKSKKSCSKCLVSNSCNCIESISPDEVLETILTKFKLEI